MPFKWLHFTTVSGVTGLLLIWPLVLGGSCMRLRDVSHLLQRVFHYLDGCKQLRNVSLRGQKRRTGMVNASSGIALRVRACELDYLL